MHLHAVLNPQDSEPEMYMMRLTNVKMMNSYRERELALYLKRVSPQSIQFVRIDPHKLSYWEFPPESSKIRLEEIYIRQRPVIPKSHLTIRPNCIRLRSISFNYASHQRGGSAEADVLRDSESSYCGRATNSCYVLVKLSRHE
jgi:hypothetical protein